MSFVRLTALLLLVPTLAWADAPLAPAPHEPLVARLVGEMLRGHHYEHVRKPIDDRLAASWMEAYLERLDPGRMYFLASDIERFEEMALRLDDELLAEPPELDIAFAVYTRYQQRTGERLAFALTALDQPIDLTDAETFEIDRRDAKWPTTAEAANDLWRKRIEYDILVGELSETDRDERVERLRKRYTRLQKEIEAVDSSDVLGAYLGALATSYDPHSTYFTPSKHDDFDIDISNAVEGIGATLRTDGEYTIIVDTIAGGPAATDGRLKPKDKIIAVAQGDGEAVDVVDLRLDKVVKLIRGSKGTEVRLTIIPSDATGPADQKVISLIRDRVKIEASAVSSTVRTIPTDGGEVRLGIIDVPSFYYDSKERRGVSADVKTELEKLESDNIDGVVLDLRRNSGGSLREAIKLTGLFIERGAVVQVRDPQQSVEVMTDPDPRQAYAGPLTVLTSPLSASASEIVAGAIQDYQRGLIVGSETTHGKGTVQQVIGLNDFLGKIYGVGSDEDIAGALKLTVQKFYRVSGDSTQARGVESDIVLPSPYDGLEIYESDLDGHLPWDRIPAAKHTDAGQIDAATLAALKERSAARIKEDTVFQSLIAQHREREQHLAETTVPLNLEESRREKEERDAKFPELPEDADPVLDEALRVFVDWLEMSATG